MASFLNTLSMLKYLAGLKPDCASRYSILEETAVVWVRSRFFSASISFQGLPYLPLKLVVGQKYMVAEQDLTTPVPLLGGSMGRGEGGAPGEGGGTLGMILMAENDNHKCSPIGTTNGYLCIHTMNQGADRKHEHMTR